MKYFSFAVIIKVILMYQMDFMRKFINFKKHYLQKEFLHLSDNFEMAMTEDLAIREFFPLNSFIRFVNFVGSFGY